MVQRLNVSDPDFAQKFETLLGAKREQSDDVDAVVREILADVRDNGDSALLAYTKKFDELELNASDLRIGDDHIEVAKAEVEEDVLSALHLARDRIAAHHERHRPEDDWYVDPVGVGLGHRWTAVESAGLYVPGGKAAYPSSVLMNAIPAKVAGVEQLTMVVPTPYGEINPLVLVAADMAGVDDIYRVGGAQAVGALAFGTETIKPVTKIVGPGNAYVAAAKRQVFGTVGIDMIAGPSEVLIIADKKNDPDWIAADLLAQAEHDEAAQSILITDDEGFADKVVAAVGEQLRVLPKANIASASWMNFGAVILVPDLEEAPPLANRIAAEHLEIAVDDPDRLSGLIRNAGSIFLGRHTPEVIGDYVAGPNHVLPTARSARFSSGLGVLDFMKRSSLLKLTAENLDELGPPAMTLAKAEGLEAHSRSVGVRLGQKVS